MRKYLVFSLAALTLRAAMIRGTVVENQMGHPVARATVRLHPVTGSPGSPRSVRTNSSGYFEFTELPAGTYLLTATRTGFATMQYGQKRWRSAGVPVVVAENDSPTLAMRLPRFGAIAGTVLDENDVGLPDHDVVAYRNTHPPQFVTRATSDDRGMYRISGLEPGTYLVRTAGKAYEDGNYLPTFSKETQIPDQAFLVEVDLDRQVEQVDVRPVTGKLFTLTVSAATIPPNPIRPLPVTITLVSELGRETVHASTWTFGPLPAGQYDLFSEAPLERGPGIQSDYRRLTVSQDTSASFVLHEEPALEFAFPGAPSQAIETGAMRVLARRKDLAGADATHVLELVNNRFQLATGPWQLALEPPSGYYVSTFSGPGHQPPPDLRADCWNDIIVSRGAAGVRFSISGSSALLHGTVKSSGEAVAGAPVFLEPLDLEPSRRVTEMLVARTDTQGQYRFTGLAPGNYRILSSFEYLAPDSEDMSNAGAKAINLAVNRNLQQDLDLYVIR